MIVHVLGKQHLEGVSKKSGQPFSFNVVFYSFKDRLVTGEKCDSITFPSGLDFDSVLPNQYYNFDFDRNGYLVNFTVVKA